MNAIYYFKDKTHFEFHWLHNQGPLGFFLFSDNILGTFHFCRVSVIIFVDFHTTEVVRLGLQLNKTVCKTKFIKPKSPKAPKTPHFSVVFFSESTRGIARGHREKKAHACFQQKFSPISVKITDKTLNKLIISLLRKSRISYPMYIFRKKGICLASLSLCSY